MTRSHTRKPKAFCAGCRLDYASPGFHDFVIPNWAWRQISPTGDEGGLLCSCCMVAALDRLGIKCEGAFMSGPIISVSQTTMANLRRIENLEERLSHKESK